MIEAINAIKHELLLARMSRFEERRDFFLTMYAQNPHLRRNAGRRVNDMLLPLAELQQSTELIELAAFANMPS